MSVAKDPKTGKWYSKFRYTDWTGKRVQKKKTGFITKREAQEWEREFLTKVAASCDMSFASLVELYMAEIMHTNFLDAGFFTAGTELGVYPAFCKWEQAVVRIVFQKPAGIVLNNGAEEIRRQENSCA